MGTGLTFPFLLIPSLSVLVQGAGLDVGDGLYTLKLSCTAPAPPDLEELPHEGWKQVCSSN